MRSAVAAAAGRGGSIAVLCASVIVACAAASDIWSRPRNPFARIVSRFVAGLSIATAGGTPIKPGHKASWGGYIGFFADPDGHLWEVAYNPGFPLNKEGRIILPP